jgi:hypothetical protein
MTEADERKWTKFILSMIKVVPSTVIDAELSKQEERAQKEHKVDDLVLVRLGQVIKKNADIALDNWIANL